MLYGCTAIASLPVPPARPVPAKVGRTAGHGPKNPVLAPHPQPGHARPPVPVIACCRTTLVNGDVGRLWHKAGPTASTGPAQLAGWPGQRPLAVLQRPGHAVLWRQPAGLPGLAGSAGPVLALEHAVRPAERVREHQGLLGDGLHRGPEEVRRAYLVLPGEDDQIVPVKDAAVKSAQLINGAQVIYYPGAPHGLMDTHADRFNADLLAFLRS